MKVIAERLSVRQRILQHRLPISARDREIGPGTHCLHMRQLMHAEIMNIIINGVELLTMMQYDNLILHKSSFRAEATITELS